MQLLINKKIQHSYEILETLEAGVALQGSEVKTLRKKHGSLKEAYVSIHDGEVFLHDCHLPHYQAKHKMYENFNTQRKRKLLLHKKQIEKLQEKIKQKGLTVIPIQIYTKGNLIKIEIAIARGKKLYDKRQDLKNRTNKREMERIMKNNFT